MITLNDPPANTYTYEMMRQLDDGDPRGADGRRACTSIVLRGAGEKFFSAGREHRDAQLASRRRFKYYFCLHANETLNRLEHTPKLVIAALNGHTRGRRPRDRDGGRHPHRAQGGRQDRPARGEPRRAARAPAARSAWRASWARPKAIEMMVTGKHVLVRQGQGDRPGERGVGREPATTGGSRCCRTRSQFVPAEQGRQGGGQHQARGLLGHRGALRERAGDRARAAAAALPERGREGGHRARTSRSGCRSSRAT